MSTDPTILEVVPGSPADVAGLAAGDRLVAINGVRPRDVIDYQQLVDDADPVLRLRRTGEEVDVKVVKGEGIPLGLRLDASIFDRVQTCDNHCEFCFIYQLPPGMRRSLYLKDDDYRLSFLYGNFTTLTRFTEFDLARVVEERLGPLYVSIHATEPEVRSEMLRNPRGGTSLRWLRALLDHGITVHGQIVLCPGINDGAVLERTLAEILVRYSALASVGIVPLGLSRFNDESRLRVHTPDGARRDLAAIEFWQERARERLGRRMFFASDEVYLVAGRPVPPSEAYEGFPQHENGIGMIRALYDEIERLEHGEGDDGPPVSGRWRALPPAPGWGYRAVRTGGQTPRAHDGGPVVIVTGAYGVRALRPVLDRLERLAGTSLRILEVENRFFGGNTAVTGLLVGEDVAAALRADQGSVGRYLLPDVTLSGDRFLDDRTFDEVAAAARAPVIPVPATAGGIVAGAA